MLLRPLGSVLVPEGLSSATITPFPGLPPHLFLVCWAYGLEVIPIFWYLFFYPDDPHHTSSMHLVQCTSTHEPSFLVTLAALTSSHLPSIPWVSQETSSMATDFFFCSSLLGMYLGWNYCTVLQAAFPCSCESQSAGWVTGFSFPVDLRPTKHG